MAVEPKTGPLSIAELEALWKSVTDQGYWRPLVEKGEGTGYEAHTQAFAQFARVSEAVDRTTQALFIRPWSGQSGEPAGGQQNATVAITFTRTGNFQRPITIAKGLLVEQVTTDYSTTGPIEVTTGRAYVLASDVIFGVGEPGPITVTALADRPGYGYNLPPPGDISRLVQVAAGATNDFATVVVGVAAHRLQVGIDPDVVLPEHVGQYVQFVSGANLGQVRRIVGYEEPTVGVNGGTALLAPTGVFHISASAGTPIVGEPVIQNVTLATGFFTKRANGYLVIEKTGGTFDATHAIIGQLSGASTTPDAIVQSPNLVAEVGTASWVILDWVSDLQIITTNAASPTGGRSAMLDQVGDERETYRTSGEDDDTYRERVATAPDVVSPPAIQRAANRVLAPIGATACLREVGLERMRGFFYDGNPSSAALELAFAYDLDFVFMVCAGAFLEGELITQTVAGVVASGRAVLDLQTAVPPLPAPIPSVTLGGVVGVHGTFVAGQPIVGHDSGTVAIPAIVVSFPVQPLHKWLTYFDYTEMRAFFLIGVPELGIGDFGFAFDTGVSNAYDANPFPAFFDGSPTGNASVYRAVWQAVDPARAYGVGFDLYIERFGCT
jgi:hypothetical protein